MSDGGFDVDELLKKRKESEKIFGVVTDPRTGIAVSYPYVSNKNEVRIGKPTTLDNGSQHGGSCSNCLKREECRLKEEGFSDLCPFTE